MILIVSFAADGHTAAVIKELSRLGGEYRLLDLSQFPERVVLDIDYSPGPSLRARLCWDGGQDLSLSDVHVVWWRRPQPVQPPHAIVRPSHYQFALSECSEAITGFWHLLDVFWINHPTRNEVAARKAYQLDVAGRVGLRIPRTLITNDPQRAREFIAEIGLGSMIYKSFSATEQEWRETRVLRLDEVPLLDNVRFAPVIFQEYVPAKADLRITVVGDRIFPAAIYSQETSYTIDFRVDMTAARIEPLALPLETERALMALMKDLKLAYGAIDMRLTPDGEFVFLEINPAGQWLFIEERTGQPITTALAELMVASESARFGSVSMPRRTGGLE